MSGPDRDADASVDATCDLCGRTIPSSGVEDGERTFCSTGCLDVATTLGAPATTGEPNTDDSGDPDGDEGTREDLARTFLRIDGMHSATCEAFLESVAEGCEGVVDAEASYVTETMRVTHDPDRVSDAELRDAASTLGYTAYLRSEATEEGESAGATRRSREMTGMRKRRDDRLLELRYAAGLLFGAFLLLPYVAVLYPVHLASVTELALLSGFERSFRLNGAGGLMFLRLSLVLAGIVLLFTGLPVLRGAYVGLRMRRPNTDLLVATTVTAAFVYSTAAALLGRTDVFYDLAVVVAAAVTAATFYESSVKQRALEELTDLTVSQVEAARLYEPDGTTAEIPVEELEAGDRVLVRAGERVPVDGVVESECTVDEAIVTGESLPVGKEEGDDAVGGSVVTDGAAVVRAGPEATSSIDRITTALWSLQSGNHGVQRRADRLAARAVAVVASAAVLAGLVAAARGSGATNAALRSLTVLLVGSPWLIGFATPLSVATGIEEALRRGIVVFDETVLERLRGVDTVVFDKTGTLTTGEMEVVEADAPPGLLDAAAALEARASHPAAAAIVAAFGRDSDRTDGGVGDERGDDPTDRVSEFATHATGVEGVVDGTPVLVGDLDLFADRGWAIEEGIESRVAEARGFGRLPVVVGRDGAAEGLVVVGDEPREGWAGTIAGLGERGIEVVVLTGDDEAATEFFARHEDVAHVFAGVPPEGKTATVERLAGRVAMVGDGTNDAPALAAADLGLSLGGGTDLAADAADVAIADDDIGSVEMAFDLASAARRRVRQNNRLALGYNAIAIPAAVAGVFNPLTAMFAAVVGGALVGANCLRDLADE
ncbi:cation-translocating P-type ATPase [Saliphagus sp. LR7]|uniref:heavy metal translocating P-type ATPase n=1 Tax=Saliphagus sp. LR7 TaxID=2282654 RepID=UPI001E358A5D|nr:heavy metal translocating P-type ATPase [Saliphagus sp. LR7]